MKKNVVVLFGGISSEHAVSCLSAAGVIRNIDYSKFSIIPVGITKDGSWLKTIALPEDIETGKWEDYEDNVNITFSINNKYKGLFNLETGKLIQDKIDVVFSVLHGKYGEDGNIQGVLECSGIPYIGCNVQSSAVCFDKVLTKEILSVLGVHQANYIVVDKQRAECSNFYNEVETYFNGHYPLFIKPAREGSSIGISKVESQEQIRDAVKLGLSCDKKVLIEEGIEGREIEVAVLGTENPRASAIGEILTVDDFYSYQAKYKEKESETRIVEDLSENLQNNIKKIALAIYNKMECKGLARVDFFLEDNGRIVFNEINTLPGFTPISMFPKLWMRSGISYKDLITYLIEHVD